MKNQITISGSYLATVIISVLLIFIGNKLTVRDMEVFLGARQEVVKAKVQRIIERVKPGVEFDEFLPLRDDKIIFEAKITGGIRKNERITAVQNFGGLTSVSPKEVKAGDSVLLINTGDEWYFNTFLRMNKILALGIFFTLCVLFFGGRKGFNTILSLGLTCAAIFAVFIPSIFSGKNIYVMSLLICVYTIIMTLLIVIGFNKKALTAVIGCASGVLVTGIITLIMDKVLLLTGIVDEHSLYLSNLPFETKINLRAIIFAGIIIGAMGAVMDVAMSISSSLWEVKEKAGKINFETLFRSGLTIGRDIMGTMANTLILAYIGCSLSVVLLLSVYSGSLLSLFNSEMIIVEILQALAGSLGILFAMPLTAFFSSILYLKNKNG